MAITTVTREIKKSEIGLASCHEHIFIKLLKTFEEPEEATKTNLFNQKISLENLHYLTVDFTCMRDNFIVGDIEVAEKELREFKKVGGKTIIDPTTVDLGRDAVALRSLSRLLDINIIATTGGSALILYNTDGVSLKRNLFKQISNTIVIAPVAISNSQYGNTTTGVITMESNVWADANNRTSNGNNE